MGDEDSVSRYGEETGCHYSVYGEKGVQVHGLDKLTLHNVHVSRLSREDLEQRYLSLYDDHIQVKKECNSLRDKLKKLGTKLCRVLATASRAREGGPGGGEGGGGQPGVIECDLILNEQAQHIKLLQAEKEQWKRQAAVLKQQLISTISAAPRTPLRPRPGPRRSTRTPTRGRREASDPWRRAGHQPRAASTPRPTSSLRGGYSPECRGPSRTEQRVRRGQEANARNPRTAVEKEQAQLTRPWNCALQRRQASATVTFCLECGDVIKEPIREGQTSATPPQKQVAGSSQESGEESKPEVAPAAAGKEAEQKESATIEALAEQQRSRVASEVDLIRARRQLKEQEEVIEGLKTRAAASERRLLVAKAALKVATQETEEATRRGAAARGEQQRLQREVAELKHRCDTQKDMEEVVRDTQGLGEHQGAPCGPFRDDIDASYQALLRERDELRAHVEHLLSLISAGAPVPGHGPDTETLVRRAVELEAELAALRAKQVQADEEESRRLDDLRRQHEKLLQKHEELLLQHEVLQKTSQQAVKSPEACESEHCRLAKIDLIKKIEELEKSVAELQIKISERSMPRDSETPSVASVGSTGFQRIPSLNQTRQVLFPNLTMPATQASAPPTPSVKERPSSGGRKKNKEVVKETATSPQHSSFVDFSSEKLIRVVSLENCSAPASQLLEGEQEQERLSRPVSAEEHLQLERELEQLRAMLRVQVDLTHMYKKEVEKLSQEVFEKHVNVSRSQAGRRGQGDCSM